MSGFSSLLLLIAGPIARQVFVSLGIGLVTFVGLDTAISVALSASKLHLGQIPASIAAILTMGGVFKGLSIIAGGITARISMVSLKRFGQMV